MAVVASHAETNGGATVAVTMPSGLASGDLILVFLSQLLGGGSQVVTPPVGFTQIATTLVANGVGSSVQSYLWYKIAGASEPSTYNFTTASGNANYSAVRVTNWDTTYTFTDFNSGTYSSGTASLTSDPYTITSFSLSRNNDLILLFTTQLGGDVTPVTSGQTWAAVVNDINTLPLSIKSTQTPTITTFPSTAITPTASNSRQLNGAIILSVKSLQIAATPFVLTATMGTPAFVRLFQAAPLILMSTVNAATVAIGNGVRNVAKNAAAFVNQTKHPIQ